jgi:hypothetical protein
VGDQLNKRELDQAVHEIYSENCLCPLCGGLGALLRGGAPLPQDVVDQIRFTLSEPWRSAVRRAK